MAAKKSTHSTLVRRRVLIDQVEKSTFQVPFIRRKFSRAPAVDPYLRPESVTTEIATYGGVSFPPILNGVQPGLDLEGNPHDYPVRVVWANRENIKNVLNAVSEQQPELQTVVSVINSFMCHLDTIRDEAAFGLSCAAGAFKSGNTDAGLESLEKVRSMLGGWDDEHRLPLH